MNIANKSTAVFILAHYDDEFGIYNQIEYHASKGDEIKIIYLTSSHLDNERDVTRENESIKALKKIGVVNKKDIYFLGRELEVPDLKLHLHLQPVFERLLRLLNSFKNIKRIYTLSYEGGHPDHDSAHVISVIIGNELNILNNTFQFPLYSGKNLVGSFFRLFSPLKENGEVLYKKIKFFNRFLYIRLFLSYLSQPKTIIGLFPFYLLHILFIGKQVLQKVTVSRIYEKPHEGNLLYQRRGMADHNCVRKELDKLISKNLVNKSLNN